MVISQGISNDLCPCFLPNLHRPSPLCLHIPACSSFPSWVYCFLPVDPYLHFRQRPPPSGYPPPGRTGDRSQGYRGAELSPHQTKAGLKTTEGQPSSHAIRPVHSSLGPCLSPRVLGPLGHCVSSLCHPFRSHRCFSFPADVLRELTPACLPIWGRGRQPTPEPNARHHPCQQIVSDITAAPLPGDHGNWRPPPPLSTPGTVLMFLLTMGLLCWMNGGGAF